MDKDTILGIGFWVVLIGGIILWNVLKDDSPKVQPSYNTEVDSVLNDDTTQETLEADPPTFHGYPCTQDCSGHEAGFDWAEEKGITDPEDCGGNSQSFIEGCEAYADEN